MNAILVFGAGGHAREVRYLCGRAKRRIVGFFVEEEYLEDRQLYGLPVFASLNEVEAAIAASPHLRIEALCAGVGDSRLKERFAHVANRLGVPVAEAIIHPGVEVDPSNQIGAGSIICAGVTMTVDIRIGRHVVVNRNATIGHGAVIEDFVTIGPGVNVSGDVRIEEGAMVGTGTSLRERVTVGPWSLVAGGAFVASDVASSSRVGGVPARPLSDTSRD